MPLDQVDDNTSDLFVIRIDFDKGCAMQIVFMGFTCRHLHQRVEEYRHFIIGNFKDDRNLTQVNLHENLKILKKYRRKLECLIFEMLIIGKKRPTCGLGLLYGWSKALMFH